VWFLAPIVLLLVAASSSKGGGASSRGKVPTFKEPATGLDEIDKVIARADNFAAYLGEMRTGPETKGFAELAKVAEASKKQAEADVKKQIDKTIDNYAAGAAVAAAATGVGVVAIPIIYLGAWAGKLAARAQLQILKWVFGGGADGWNDTWRSHAEGEIAWLAERGIPFPQFSQKWHVSPMGYVNGGGGTSCGQMGLCGLRRNFSPAATNDAQGKDPAWQGAQDPTVAQHAVAAMAIVRKHLEKNPFSFAMFVTSQAWRYDWTYDAASSAELKTREDKSLQLLRSGAPHPNDFSVIRSDAGFGPRPAWYPDAAYPWDKLVVAQIRFWHMLVAAIATSVAQERGVTPALWSDMIGKAWEGWNEGIAAHAKWAPTRPQSGWWAPGSPAPWGIAYAFMQAQSLADYIINKIPGGQTSFPVKMIDPGVFALLKG
jgi:hypothetical protein